MKVDKQIERLQDLDFLQIFNFYSKDKELFTNILEHNLENLNNYKKVKKFLKYVYYDLDNFINQLSENIKNQRIKLFITKKHIYTLQVWFYNKDGIVEQRFYMLNKEWSKSMKSYFKSYKTNFYNFDYDNINNFEYFFEANLMIYLHLDKIFDKELGYNKNFCKEEKYNYIRNLFENQKQFPSDIRK